jgi:hypothetical protein
MAIIRKVKTDSRNITFLLISYQHCILSFWSPDSQPDDSFLPSGFIGMKNLEVGRKIMSLLLLPENSKSRV